MARKLVDKIAGWVLILAGLWLAQVRLIVDRFGEFLPDWLQWLYERDLPVYFALFAAFVVLKAYVLRRSKVDRHRGLQRIVDALVAEVMHTPPNFSEYAYRASVYKFRTLSLSGWWANRHVPGVTPWSGWLVGIARSGDPKSKCRTVFRAPRGQGLGVVAGHGVCGTAWLLGTESVDNLPVVTPTSGARAVERYASRSYMTPVEVAARLAKQRSLARSIHGERFGVGGKARWGVLVYDSVEPAAVIDNLNASGNRLGVQSISLFIEEFVK